MATAFNKVTRIWTSTDAPEELSTDWLIDPVFANREVAMTVGPEFWTYSGNVISGLTDAEIIATPAFLSKYQEDAWAKIKDERERRKTYGGYKVGTNWYHSDDTSRIQQIGLVILGANLPGNIMWKTMSGGFILMTPTLANQIFQAALMSDMTVFTVAEQKRAEMMTLPDPRTYNCLTGWPLIYGE
jgi:hypothetical protein